MTDPDPCSGCWRPLDEVWLDTLDRERDRGEDLIDCLVAADMVVDRVRELRAEQVQDFDAIEPDAAPESDSAGCSWLISLLNAEGIPWCRVTPLPVLGIKGGWVVEMPRPEYCDEGGTVNVTLDRASLEVNVAGGAAGEYIRSFIRSAVANQGQPVQ